MYGVRMEKVDCNPKHIALLLVVIFGSNHPWVRVSI